jgi:hypothetical protein
MARIEPAGVALVRLFVFLKRGSSPAKTIHEMH